MGEASRTLRGGERLGISRSDRNVLGATSSVIYRLNETFFLSFGLLFCALYPYPSFRNLPYFVPGM
jgi:hypothetical protein